MSYIDWLRDLEEDCPLISSRWVDAGISAIEAEGQVVIPRNVWVAAGKDSVEELRKLELYTNQSYRIERDPWDDSITCRWRYGIPCITELP